MHCRQTPTAFEADELDPEFQIGVCDEGFNVFARITMRGADGVRRIQSDLADMGYRSVSFGTSAQMRGCDLLMVRRPVTPSIALR
ncbi:hypothetical protein GCM10028796_56410 [Ramlibacter monticola]|uniref:Uncharacterized protein n=1 Tax=Ramlibacter monticola TaxID=1926872 RepID=A0A937CWC2_9BURK|nr:hypothetical protein [Ramlibacter monticola]MBL0395116.1 hypothetical protein [Ramlibacter monticola]